MTATTATLSPVPLRRPLTAGVHVTMGGVLRSEWIKFRSLRSTVIALALCAVLTVGFGALISAITAANWSSASAGDKATFDPVATSLRGVMFAQLAVGVLGVMFMGSEYSTGMIRSSLTVVPKRLPVLWAKVIVFIAMVLPLSLVATFTSFFLGQSLLDTQHIGVSLSATGALREVTGAALYLVVAGILGLGLGALLRNTAGGISTYVGLLFVLPPILTALPSSYASATKYLPAAAGQALWGGTTSTTTTHLTPWVGFAVMCLWAVVTVAAAAGRLRRRDV